MNIAITADALNLLGAAPVSGEPLDLKSQMEIVSNLLHLAQISTDPEDALKYATMANKRLRSISGPVNH